MLNVTEQIGFGAQVDDGYKFWRVRWTTNISYTDIFELQFRDSSAQIPILEGNPTLTWVNQATDLAADSVNGFADSWTVGTPADMFDNWVNYIDYSGSLLKQTNTLNKYVGYAFEQAVEITQVVISARYGAPLPNSFVIEASNDNSSDNFRIKKTVSDANAECGPTSGVGYYVEIINDIGWGMPIYGYVVDL